MNKQATKEETLPDGWRWVKLGEVCEIIAGQSPPGATYRSTPDGIPFFQGKSDFGKISPVARVWCVMPKKIAEPGDILISIRAPVGPTNVADIRCAIGRGLAAIRCNNGVDSSFILYSLRHFEAILIASGSGSTFQAINRDDLESLQIPLPPLPEQKRIATILKEKMAAVEDARVAAQTRLETIKALPTAFLRQVFPQPDQSIPDGWRWVKLEDVCKVVGGSTPDTANLSYWNGDIVWVTPTDLGKLFSTVISKSERLLTTTGREKCNAEILPIGAVVMSSRAPIGHLAIAEKPLCTNQGCKSFVPNKNIDSIFLYWALKKAVPAIQSLGSGATFTEVSKFALQAFEIPLPPLAEQKRIATALREQMAAVEKSSTAAEEELNTINVIPAALLRRAFGGKL